MFIQSHSKIMQSTQSKCCEIRITSWITNMQPFYKTVSRTPSEYFVPNVFNKRNLPEIQDKHFVSRFNAWRRRFLQKNVFRLLKTKLWAKFSETWNKDLVQSKLLSKIKQKSTTANVPEKYETNIKMRWTTNI